MGKNPKHSCKDLARYNPRLKLRILYKKPVFGGKPRSTKWPSIRRAHLKANDVCLACGGRTSLVVHHLVPYQIDPSLELDSNNLITLCESKSRCHWIIGHLLDWRSYNPNAKADALAFRLKILNRPVINRDRKKNTGS